MTMRATPQMRKLAEAKARDKAKKWKTPDKPEIMKTLQDKPDFEKLEDEFNNYILSPYTTKVSASTMAHFLWFKNKLTEFYKAASSRTEGLQKEIEELKKQLTGIERISNIKDIGGADFV